MPAGGVVLALAAAGYVDVAGPGEAAKPERLTIRNADPPGTLSSTRDLPRRPPRGQASGRAGGLAKGLRESLLARLTQRGILHADEGKILGIFPTRSWPGADPAHENAVRRGPYDVLWVGRSPEPREAALISLLHAVDQVPVVVSSSPLSKRDLRRHAKEIAAGDFAGEAARTGIDGVNAAVTTSILAATTASSAGSH